MWAYLFNCIQQIWCKNLQNFELGTCQLFPGCCPTSLKFRNLAPWVLPWIPPWPLPFHGFSHGSQTLWVPWVLPWNLPWPLPYYGFSHRSQTLWVPWVMPWNPQLFSLSTACLKAKKQFLGVGGVPKKVFALIFFCRSLISHVNGICLNKNIYNLRGSYKNINRVTISLWNYLI